MFFGIDCIHTYKRENRNRYIDAVFPQHKTDNGRRLALSSTTIRPLQIEKCACASLLSSWILKKSLTVWNIERTGNEGYGTICSFPIVTKQHSASGECTSRRLVGRENYIPGCGMAREWYWICP